MKNGVNKVLFTTLQKHKTRFVNDSAPLTRQSAGCSPTAQEPNSQETARPFGGDPFPFPGSCRLCEGTDDDRASIMLMKLNTV